MVTGIGIDMIEVERVHDKISKEHGFREFVYSKREINYCEDKAHKYEHYAARFACKEAFFKAIGTGWKSGTNFNEIEIIDDEVGKPQLFLQGETAESISKLGQLKVSVSLTHLKTFASAVVIIEM